MKPFNCISIIRTLPVASPVRKSARILGGVLLLLFLPLAPAHADGVDIEINKMEQRESGCLFYLLTNNSSGRNYESLKLDMVLFDSADLIQRRIAVDMAPLKTGKTSVKLFEISDTQCETIGKVLINDVLECSDEAGPVSGCIDRISPASRIDVELFM